MTKSAKRKAHDARRVDAYSAQQSVHASRQQFDRRNPPVDTRPLLRTLPQVPLAAPYHVVPIHRYDMDNIMLGGHAHIVTLMPSYDEITEEFTQRHGKHHDLVTQWFFCGLSKFEPIPRDGIDPTAALRHLTAIMRSFQPTHEHKIASVRFLIDTWFSSVVWVASDRGM